MRIKLKNKKNILLIILRIIFIIAFLVSSFFIIKWFLYNKKTSDMSSKLSEYISSDSSDDNSQGDNRDSISIDFDGLISQNNECCAWLIVNGTDINYPVVQHNNNDFYLTHSFDKTYNTAGWIFADYNNLCNGLDRNLVIYGHNRKDGSMFASLINILNESWYKNEDNLIIYLYTPDGLMKYEVFSVYNVKAEDYYITTTFSSDSEYMTFLNTLKKRSVYNFNKELNTDDKIITLSTCSNNNANRTVLHAKKIQAD